MATNFLNPASFIPPNDWRPKGFLGGMRNYDQNQDYRKLMEQSTQLQDLGLQEAGIDLSQKRKGVPLADLQREVAMETARGQRPHARDVASEAALGKIAKSQYEGVQYGPGGQQALKDSWARAAKAGLLEQKLREKAVMENMIQTAQGMPPEQRSAYLQSEYSKYSKAGYELPQSITDPNTHARWQQSLVESTKHLQDLAKEKNKADLEELSKGKDRSSREKIANIGASATRYAADQRGKGSAADMTAAKALSILTAPGADINDPTVRHAFDLLKAHTQSRLKVSDMDFGLMLQYMQEAGTAKSVEEAQAVDQKYLKLHMMSKNPVLNRGDPRTSGGQINQGPTNNNSDPLGLFQ